MSTEERRWTVRLSATAEADFHRILRWTSAQFGEAQARSYADTLVAALKALSAGPNVVGARKREDIAAGLLTLHVARQGRKGRHLIVFRAGHDRHRPAVEVLRLIHDAMDPQRHLPRDNDRI